MSRKAILAVLGLVLLFCTVAGVAVSAARPQSAISLAKALTIKDGMDRGTVEEILGGPARIEATRPLVIERHVKPDGNRTCVLSARIV